MLGDKLLFSFQTDEFADLLGDQKEEIESISLRNTIINGGMEKLADCIKESPGIKVCEFDSSKVFQHHKILFKIVEFFFQDNFCCK